MKLSISKDIVRKDGILYVLCIKLEGKDLVKVGVTCRNKVEDRVCEILTSIHSRYRIFPETYVKRYRKTSDVYSKEAEMHKLLDEYSYKTEHTFGGCTEMFDVDLDLVVELYEELLKDKE